MPARSVVTRAAGHGGEVEHRDDRLVDAEEPTEQGHAGPRTSASRVAAVRDARDRRRFGAVRSPPRSGLLDALDLLGVGADDR